MSCIFTEHCSSSVIQHVLKQNLFFKKAEYSKLCIQELLDAPWTKINKHTHHPKQTTTIHQAEK